MAGQGTSWQPNSSGASLEFRPFPGLSPSALSVLEGTLQVKLHEYESRRLLILRLHFLIWLG